MGKVRKKRKSSIFNRYSLLCVVLILLTLFIFGIFDSTNYHTISEEPLDPPIDEIIFDNLPEDTTSILLKLMYLKDSRVKKILEDYNAYPKVLLETLARDKDMLDFVLGYKEKYGNVYGTRIDDVEEGKIPLIIQWDERWGYATYGKSIIAISGCGPTALSMVIVGLTGNNNITPYTVAKYAEENRYYVSGIGSSWELLTTGAKHFGVTGKKMILNKENVFNNLKNGNPIISSMRPGDFTKTGHFIVLTGIKDGKIVVNDPNSRERSKKLWDYETIAPQIKGLWSYNS